MEKIYNFIISFLTIYSTISILRDESEYLYKIAKLKNLLLWTRISLALTLMTFGGFLIW